MYIFLVITIHQITQISNSFGIGPEMMTKSRYRHINWKTIMSPTGNTKHVFNYGFNVIFSKRFPSLRSFLEVSSKLLPLPLIIISLIIQIWNNFRIGYKNDEYIGKWNTYIKHNISSQMRSIANDKQINNDAWRKPKYMIC